MDPEMETDKGAAGESRAALWFRAFLIRVIVASVLFLSLFLMDFIKEDRCTQAKNIVVQSIASDSRIEALETLAEGLIFPEKN